MFRDSNLVSSWEITQPNLNLRTFYDTELISEGEGPSRGLLRDYESSDGPSFQALVQSVSPVFIAGADTENCTFTKASPIAY